MSADVLLIKTNEDPLHTAEYVHPIASYLKSINVTYSIQDLKDMSVVSVPEKVVIVCGTSVQDFSYERYTEKMKSIMQLYKPMLGICAGAQLLADAKRCKLQRHKVIGMRPVSNASGIASKVQECYCLFSNIATGNFEVLGTIEDDVPVAWKSGSIYGIMFHPEVRNMHVIQAFLDDNLK